MVASVYGLPIKKKKPNIDTEEVPKMAIIGDYWDKDIVIKFIDLLKEYEDFFPLSFSDMEGITRSLSVMMIQLNSVTNQSKGGLVN